MGVGQRSGLSVKGWVSGKGQNNMRVNLKEYLKFSHMESFRCKGVRYIVNNKEYKVYRLEIILS